MNRVLFLAAVLSVVCAVGSGPSAECAACPLVAMPQAVASVSSFASPPAVAVLQPMAAPAVAPQAVASLGYPLTTAFAAPVVAPFAVGNSAAFSQPVVFAPATVSASAGCAGGSCARASVRSGSGARRMLLPRQRAVSRVVVR